MRKKDCKLRNRLIDCANQIERKEGMDAINIRRLAAEANISVGTVYNYFESKQEVLFALTEDFWTTTIEEMSSELTSERFSGQIQQIITYLRVKMTERAEILMKNLHDDGAGGRARMVATQRVLHQAMVERLKQDRFIRPDVWDDTLTIESFADFVLSQVVMLLQRRQANTDTFITIIERILY
ncbi:MAG: TetR/AcrR family transcriptional regulator [Eubacteriales bacterium]